MAQKLMGNEDVNLEKSTERSSHGEKRTGKAIKMNRGF